MNPLTRANTFSPLRAGPWTAAVAAASAVLFAACSQGYNKSRPSKVSYRMAEPENEPTECEWCAWLSPRNELTECEWCCRPIPPGATHEVHGDRVCSECGTRAHAEGKIHL